MGAGAIPLQIEKALKDRIKSKHKLQIFTAHDTYDGDDRIDVSMDGGLSIMVPPKPLLMDYKLGRINERAFQQAYFKFLEESFVQYQHTWDTILNGNRTVLVCSCNADDKSCQRHFIIKFLKQFGAVYKGKLKEK